MNYTELTKQEDLIQNLFVEKIAEFEEVFVSCRDDFLFKDLKGNYHSVFLTYNPERLISVTVAYDIQDPNKNIIYSKRFDWKYRGRDSVVGTLLEHYNFFKSNDVVKQNNEIKTRIMFLHDEGVQFDTDDIEHYVSTSIGNYGPTLIGLRRSPINITFNVNYIECANIFKIPFKDNLDPEEEYHLLMSVKIIIQGLTNAGR